MISAAIEGGTRVPTLKRRSGVQASRFFGAPPSLPQHFVARRIRLRRHRAFDPAAELNIPIMLNAGLAGLLGIVFGLVKLGLSLPFGSSFLLVGRRPIAA